MERTWRVLVMQESASKRDLWKRKVEQIVEETDSLGLGIDRHFKKVWLPESRHFVRDWFRNETSNQQYRP